VATDGFLYEYSNKISHADKACILGEIF
jgi:hypothetical protein